MDAVEAEQLLMRVPSNRSTAVPSRKELGAYYTDAAVASFLVCWAVVMGHETVLDPSCGDGVFLTTAAERIRRLGGDATGQVRGVEIDDTAYRRLTLRAVDGLESPRVIHAGAVAPNTLHLVRLRPDCGVHILDLAAAWQTSLTALSCELEGHSLGGGMLKLEPTEARRMVIAMPALEPEMLDRAAVELDNLL